MSSIKTIFIRTSSGGAYTYERNFNGVVRAVEVQLGDLSTPDIDVTDGVYGTSLVSVNGLAADALYLPSDFLQDDAGADVEIDTGVKAATPAVIMGTLKVAVTGGGDTKKGRVIVLYD